MLTRVQGLTIAEALLLAAAEVNIVKARQEEFAQLGFELEVASDTDVLLKGVPGAVTAARLCRGVAGFDGVGAAGCNQVVR